MKWGYFLPYQWQRISQSSTPIAFQCEGSKPWETGCEMQVYLNSSWDQRNDFRNLTHLPQKLLLSSIWFSVKLTLICWSWTWGSNFSAWQRAGAREELWCKERLGEEEGAARMRWLDGMIDCGTWVWAEILGESGRTGKLQCAAVPGVLKIGPRPDDWTTTF